MSIREWLKNRNKVITGSERGATLVEAAVTVLILGGGVLTMVLSMSGGALAVRENDRQVVAQGLARTQMEYTKEYPYDPDATTYPAISVPESYGITIAVTAVPDTNSSIQKVTANVTEGGVNVLTIEDYKVDR